MVCEGGRVWVHACVSDSESESACLCLRECVCLCDLALLVRMRATNGLLNVRQLTYLVPYCPLGVRALLQWLEVWAGKRRAPKKTKKEKERAKKIARNR